MNGLAVDLLRGLLAIGIGYLLGSILPAELFARRRGIDISSVGDGNPGTVNAMRGLGWVDGVLTLVYDGGVGILSILIASRLLHTSEAVAYLCGLSAILGHRVPLFRGFRPGGQGMAASAGLLLYGLAIAHVRGQLPIPACLVLASIGAAVLAITRSGVATGLVLLPTVVVALLITGADWPVLGLVAAASAHIWIVQERRARSLHVWRWNRRITGTRPSR